MSESLRILDIPARPDPDLVREFEPMVTAHLSDSMSRLCAGGAALRPMHRGGKLVGPAFTVRTAYGDNLLVHKALEMAQAGDVIVVDAGGLTGNAIIGEMMAAHAKQRGMGGIVIWGAIRDSAAIASSDFPVYAAGVTHRGPYRNGPGEINVPIILGEMVVHPGDIMVGDADGLVAVPPNDAERILRSARTILAKENEFLKSLSAGTVDRSWVDRTLKEKGYKIP